MASEVSKPDFSFQWSSGGSIVAPSDVKIQTGWTAEVPPFQWENWSQNRQDNAILHLFQKGISEWDATSNYYFTTSGVRSYVQGSDGNIYVAVQDSVGQNPTTDATDTYWKIAFIDQTALATALSESAPNVASASGVSVDIPSASATATFTIGSAIVGVGLTGASYRLATVSKSINLATTGAGGMDTGTAPVSGYVAIYLIYNPSLALSSTNPSLLAREAVSASRGEVYGGANMPAGYTASALISVVATNASSQFKTGQYQTGRKVAIDPVQVLAGVLNTPTYTSLSIAGAVPLNAKLASMTMQGTSTVSTLITFQIASTANGMDAAQVSSSPVTQIGAPARDISLLTPQTVFRINNASTGTTAFQVFAVNYTF
jgi:hypothetical protein